MRTQFRSRVKSTGGLYKRVRKKKKRDFGKDFIPIKIGEKRKKVVRGLSRISKERLLQANMVNVYDPSSKKTIRTKILTVKDNPANPHFVRMNVITKGVIIETELGIAKVVSRPGQEGVVNAILLEK